MEKLNLRFKPSLQPLLSNLTTMPFSTINNMSASEVKYQMALGTLSVDNLITLANNSTSNIILNILSNHKDWTVRLEVAKNINTSKQTLEHLSKDEEWIVRRATAGNLSTAEKDLLVLTRDESKHVQEIATETLSKRKGSK